MRSQRSQKRSWIISVGLHAVLIGCLLFSFEKTIFVPEEKAAPQEKIIDAVAINQKALEAEKARLVAIEDQRKREARQREEASAKRVKEAEQKRLAEEARLAELKQKSDQAKREADAQKKAQQKALAEQNAKLQEKEAALKKLAKEKEAMLAEKQKIEAEKAKAQKEAKMKEITEKAAKQEATAQKMKQDVITHFASLMRNKIHQNWRQPIGLDIGGFKCKVAVKLLPTGDVVDARVVSSSGNVEFDRSAEVAIRKASPLPVPEDPAIAREFRQFTFTFHPEAA